MKTELLDFTDIWTETISGKIPTTAAATKVKIGPSLQNYTWKKSTYKRTITSFVGILKTTNDETKSPCGTLDILSNIKLYFGFKSCIQRAKYSQWQTANRSAITVNFTKEKTNSNQLA